MDSWIPLVRLLIVYLSNHILTFYPGSFTFAKTLEYKAKQGLQSGKEVTVMPPAEYHERFVNALEGYFVACPGQSNYLASVCFEA